MPALRFDWRWIALIIIVIILFNAQSLPWPLTALALALPAGWLLYRAGQSLGLSLPGSRSSTRVTYWRGRRIETSGPPRQMVSFDRSGIATGILYGALGLAFAGAAVVVVTRHLGG